MADLPRLYTPATLAERWECSANQVCHLIRSGKLAAFKVGRGRYRIRPQAVEEYECQGAHQKFQKAPEPANTEGSGAPSGKTPKVIDAESFLKWRQRQKQRRHSGNSSALRRGA